MVELAARRKVATDAALSSTTLLRPQKKTIQDEISPPVPTTVWQDWDPAIPKYMLEGLIPGPRYVAQSELHKQATLLFPIKPEYPENALNVQGVVVVLVLINETGAIDKVGVIESNPPFVFDHSALEAFKTVRYLPGTIADIPVKSKLFIEITYEPGSAPRTAFKTLTPEETAQSPSTGATKSLGNGN